MNEQKIKLISCLISQTVHTIFLKFSPRDLPVTFESEPEYVEDTLSIDDDWEEWDAPTGLKEADHGKSPWQFA